MKDIAYSFLLDRWYCLNCTLHPAQGSRTSGEYGQRAHQEQEHGIAKEVAEAGVDYCEGFQARIIWRRRQREAEEKSNRAARLLLEPHYTVDDFLTDCGDEIWKRTE